MAMANKLTGSRELLDRWRGIAEEEENDDDDHADPSKHRNLHLLKQQWLLLLPRFLFSAPERIQIIVNNWLFVLIIMELLFSFTGNYFDLSLKAK